MKEEKKPLFVWLGIVALLLVLAIAAAPPGGLFANTGALHWAGLLMVLFWLAVALVIRFAVIPKFTFVPGRFQLCLEQLAAALSHLPAIKKPFIAIGKGIVALFRGIGRLGRKIAAFRPDRRTKTALAVWGVVVLALLALCLLVGSHGGHQDIQTAMRDAVLHDTNRVSLFGMMEVNPGFIAAMTVSAALLLFALVVRLFVIPRFRDVPGKFQSVLELAVSTLDSLAGVAESAKRTFIGAYVFAAGAYIFFGTLFELLGVQAVASNGASVTLPAPLSDVNAAICMGCLSYLVIFGCGVARRGIHGATATLKEFSLPISMSFRLFGALLSGLLVTDLVYHYTALSYGVPVVVGVMFTLLHALIQTYVLCMLVGIYHAEVTEEHEAA